MRYLLTYTETVNDCVYKKDLKFRADSDAFAIQHVKEVLTGRDVTDITLWRWGDFVILGREAV